LLSSPLAARTLIALLANDVARIFDDLGLHGKAKRGKLVLGQGREQKVFCYGSLQEHHLLGRLFVHGRNERVAQRDGLAADGLPVAGPAVRVFVVVATAAVLVFPAPDAAAVLGDLVLHAPYLPRGGVFLPVLVVVERRKAAISGRILVGEKEKRYIRKRNQPVDKEQKHRNLSRTRTQTATTIVYLEASSLSRFFASSAADGEEIHRSRASSSDDQ
jgi:hypothetical protein